MSTIQTRIDERTKAQAEFIFNKLGLSLSDAIRLFLSQSIIDRGLPFQPKLNDELAEETLQAIKEVEKGIHSKKFHSVQEMIDDLKK